MRAYSPGRGLFTACLALVSSITAAPLAAQILYGSIVGVVRDTQGAVMPGATITIVNRDTNLTREMMSDGQGNYSLVNVLPGPYDVKVSLQGFRDYVRSGVPVSIGQIARVDVTLELGTVTETITVASASSLLQTDKADVSTELKSEVIEQVPTNRFRNFQALINLVPGTMPMSFGNAETDTPARSMTTNVNGQANTNNSTRTDGATNVNIWLPNHLMYVSPAETVDSVNVSTATFDAEQGMAGGAAVTVITKSGTNHFRGSAFEYFNNQDLNASPFNFTLCTINCAPSGKPKKLPYEVNNFGASVGGPIKRDKLFFFTSYDGFRRSHQEHRFFTVPDAALRAGDFSAATNNAGTRQIIHNPFTGTNGVGRVPFEGNRIPANMFDPVALRVLNLLYPLPNTTGTGLGGLTNNYQRIETREFIRDNYDMKINFNRTSAHQLWGKYSYMSAVVDDLSNYLGPPSNTENPDDGGFTKVYSATFGQTWTLNSSTLLDTTFGFARQDQDVYGPDFNAGNYGLDVLGIPGTNDAGLNDRRYAGYPQFNMSSFSAVGNRDGWNPIFRDERTYSLAANVTKFVGRHDLRTGATINYMYLDHWQPESGNPRGRFNFAGNATALSGGQASNFYNTFAAFLMGLTSDVGKSVQNELMTTREWQHALFFRDRWTVNDKLTLDLGLRWEYYPIATRADGRGVERLDLSTLNVIIGGRSSNPRNVGLSAGKDNFAPRLGIIYRLNDNNVFRSGYGITYNNMAWGRPMRGDLQYPITLATTFTQPLTFQWYNRLGEGIPQVVGPNQSTGSVALPNAVGMTTPELGNVDRGMIQTWNVSFERRLPLDISLDIAYVGAKGTGGYGWIDANLPTTYGGGASSRPYFISHGRQLDTNVWGSILDTDYDSLQVAINRPFRRGFMLKGAYTLSRAMNETDADGRTGLAFGGHPLEQHRSWARAGFDRPHNLQLGWVYELPWQSTDGGSRSAAKWVLGDWQLNGVFAAFSGTPFHVTANGASLNTPGITQTANFSGGELKILGNIGAAGKWFDTTQFSQPTGVTIGNVKRNQFRGPNGWTLDLSLFRSFSFGAMRRLEVRAEAGNILNNPVFGNPNTDLTSGQFGQILGIPGGGGTINANAAYLERQIRLGLRFTF